MTNQVESTLQGLNQDTTYIVRVRTVNPFGIASDWSDSMVVHNGSIAGSGDTGGGISGIPTPTGLTPIAGISSVLLSWDTAPIPILRWEIYATTDLTAVIDDSLLIGSVTGNMYSLSEAYDASVRSTLVTGVAVKVFLVAVSVNGTDKSDPATVVVTPSGVSSGNIDPSEHFTSWFIQGGTFQTATDGTTHCAFQMDNKGIRLVQLDLTGAVVATKFEVDNLTGGVAMNIGAGTSSFHIDKVGNIWSGADLLASAPFKIAPSGNVTLSNGADLQLDDGGTITVGTPTVGSNIQLLKTSSAQSEIHFRSATVPKARILFSTVGASDALIIGDIGASLDAMYIGAGIAYPSLIGPYMAILRTGAGTSNFGFRGVSNDLFTIGYTGSDSFITIPSDLPIQGAGSYSNVLIKTSPPFQLFKSSSSIRYKENVRDLDEALDPHETLMALRPRVFNRKDGGRTEYGFIAEEINEIQKALVVFENDEKTPADIMYNSFIPILVKAYQSLHDRLVVLESVKRRKS